MNGSATTPTPLEIKKMRDICVEKLRYKSKKVMRYRFDEWQSAQLQFTV